MLRAPRRIGKPDEIASGPRAPAYRREITGRPSARRIPPELVDIAGSVKMYHVLGTLAVEQVPKWISRRGDGSSLGGEIARVPPARRVPPELVDVVVAAAIDHVLRPLCFERISGRVALRK